MKRKRCQECKQIKKDVKLRVNAYKEAIIYEYQKHPLELLCDFCDEELSNGI